MSTMGPYLQTYCIRGHELTPENRIQCEPIRLPNGRCRLCSRAASAKGALVVKAVVLARYGKNGKLQCCWPDCDVTDIDMLSLDHVNDNGAEDRREHYNRAGTTLYRFVRHQGFPSEFQTLCMNHQTKKEMERRRAGR